MRCRRIVRHSWDRKVCLPTRAQFIDFSQEIRFSFAFFEYFLLFSKFNVSAPARNLLHGHLNSVCGARTAVARNHQARNGHSDWCKPKHASAHIHIHLLDQGQSVECIAVDLSCRDRRTWNLPELTHISCMLLVIKINNHNHHTPLALRVPCAFVFRPCGLPRKRNAPQQIEQNNSTNLLVRRNHKSQNNIFVFIRFRCVCFFLHTQTSQQRATQQSIPIRRPNTSAA